MYIPLRTLYPEAAAYAERLGDQRRWQSFVVRRDLIVEGAGVRIVAHPCMRQVEVSQPRQITSPTEPFLRKLTFYTLDEMRALSTALRLYVEAVDDGAHTPIPERAPL